MKYLLFVWLFGTQTAESGWLPFDSLAECQAKQSWYLEQLKLSDGTTAERWLVECLEIKK